MKNIKHLTMSPLLFLPLLSECESSSREGDAKPVPITLSTSYVKIDESNPVARIEIRESNSSYRIIFPKYIQAGTWGEDRKVTFTNGDILDVQIENQNTIIVARKLLTPNMVADANLLIADNKGNKKQFVVGTPGNIGNLFDLDEVEKKLLADPNYRQN